MEHSHNNSKRKHKTLHEHAHHNLDMNSSLLLKSLILTVSFMIVEIVVGIISQSLTILSDAGHMFTDALALALSWIAIYYSKRPANSIFTYGYHRFQIIATLINGLSLLILSIYIIYEAIIRLFEPITLEGKTLIYVGLAGAVVNAIAFWIISKSSHKDMNIKSALLHVISDLLGSLAAFVAGVVIIYTGWMNIDPILSLFISILLLKTTWRLIKQSSMVLMESSPEGITPELVKTQLLKLNTLIIDIHHIHIWSISSTSNAITLHVIVNSNINNQDELIKNMREFLHSEFSIDHITIQIETKQCDEMQH
ncbi:MAG: cation transporter [Alphaproteobacteria bacterium]|jgi:cobalt-zinc-cadmium efflux system protein|nr:cation transporter [Alphaproteobacteria bacterium]